MKYKHHQVSLKNKLKIFSNTFLIFFANMYFKVTAASPTLDRHNHHTI